MINIRLPRIHAAVLQQCDKYARTSGSQDRDTEISDDSGAQNLMAPWEEYRGANWQPERLRRRVYHPTLFQIVPRKGMKGILLPSTGPGCNELGNYSCSSRKQGRWSLLILAHLSESRVRTKPLARRTQLRACLRA